MCDANKKPFQVLAHLEGQGGKTHCEKEFSRDDFITFNEKVQVSGRIWPLLGIGADNAVSRSMLASMLGTSERDIRRLVNRERRAGLPICSDTERAGYFRPATLADVERFARSMERRARHTAQVAEAARRYLDETTGQQRLEGVFANE